MKSPPLVNLILFVYLVYESGKNSFDSINQAKQPGTRLIMVGDSDQLPSVGAGNVLRDMIESGFIAVSKLNEIYRQAQESMIVVNAHRINYFRFDRIWHLLKIVLQVS